MDVVGAENHSQTLCDLDTQMFRDSLNWRSLSCLTSWSSGILQKQDCRKQRGCRKPGKYGPLNQLSRDHMSSQKLKSQTQDLHGSAPDLLCLCYDCWFSIFVGLLTVGVDFSDSFVSSWDNQYWHLLTRAQREREKKKVFQEENYSTFFWLDFLCCLGADLVHELLLLMSLMAIKPVIPRLYPGIGPSSSLGTFQAPSSILGLLRTAPCILGTTNSLFSPVKPFWEYFCCGGTKTGYQYSVSLV